MNKLTSVKALGELQSKLEKNTLKEGDQRLRVCCGTACTATGAYKVIDAFEAEAKEKGLDIEIVKTGCQGLCQKGPVMIAEPKGFFYQRVKEHNTRPIVDYTYVGGEPFRASLYREDFTHEPIPDMEEIPFYKK